MSERTNLILNSLIELDQSDKDGKGKGRFFVSKFIEPGLAHYKELGDILITKETLDKFINTMVGCPVIIDHKDVTDRNVDDLRVGVISRVWFNEFDGWYYCEGILTDDEAIDLIKNQGWSVSCSYSFTSDNTEKTYHGKPIDMEFTDGEFLHLAIVEDPRYEGANIVVNKKDDDIEWITVRGNHIPIKKGQSKDEAVKEFLKDKEGKSGDSLKGKYADEDADFDEEQAKKDIEEAKKQGHKDIDDIADYLGLDSEEVIALTGEGYEDEDKSGDSEEKGEFSEWSDGRLKGEIHTLEDEVDEIDDKLQRLDDKLRRSKRAVDRYQRSQAKGYEEDIKSLEAKRDKKNQQLDKLIKEQESRSKTNNSIGDITMTILNDLTDFIKKVVSNEKEDDMKKVKNEDKRKLIDEVGGILKDKVDEELWRTVIGKLEKIAYEPSEDSKTDNEDDEEKEAKNKCKNEDDEKEEKKEDKKVEDEEDEEEKDEDVTKNEDEEKEDDKKEVKNSLKDIVMGGNGQAKEIKIYTSQKERLEEGNKY